MEKIKDCIEKGTATLGIELGSTRIKAVLIDTAFNPIVSGEHNWENQLVDGVWSYSLEAVWTGLQDCYQNLINKVKKQYGIVPKRYASIGVSGMMHGYLVLDQNEKQLELFHTWRNTMTKQAAEELSNLFEYNIPQRWSIAHLYQCILNGDSHVEKISTMTTLAGYIHWQLTGEKVVGVGEASGMFPIDIDTHTFDSGMITKFEEKTAEKKYPWKLVNILPRVAVAGKKAGILTEAGAKMLDVSGELQSGIPMCPPEGDAGTGMVATNSVSVRTGNVSAGTSVFAMIVLERRLSKMYEEIDLVTTPAGDLVAMVHCNNCTSDLNAWVSLFKEFAQAAGIRLDSEKLYSMLYHEALSADADCGGMLAYNFYSGEHIVGMEEGRPLLVRKPEGRFTLANLMRTHLFTSLAGLRVGLDILIQKEKVKLDLLFGHGGLFKTKEVGQSILAAVSECEVLTMDTAGEGGAWGIALLAAYMVQARDNTLRDFLANQVFLKQKKITAEPNVSLVESFRRFYQRYLNGLEIERAATEML